ncbi:MAG: hypothetical protein AAB680_02215 [Pseudomonadota bacterium]
MFVFKGKKKRYRFLAIMSLTLTSSFASSCGAGQPPPPKKDAQVAASPTNATNHTIESLLGSIETGSLFANVPKPMIPLSFTPPTPSEEKCSWSVSDSDEGKVMCSYLAADGFIYKIDGEMIIGVVLKPNDQGVWPRPMPFGLTLSDSPNDVIHKLRSIGYVATRSVVDEPNYFIESVCWHESPNIAKIACIDFDRNLNITSVEVSKGEEDS